MGKSYLHNDGERRCDACQGKMPETGRLPNAGYLAVFDGAQPPADVVTRTCVRCGAVDKLAERSDKGGGPRT